MSSQNPENTTSLEELRKASASLIVANQLLGESLLKEPEHKELHKALRDACIQRFEFCIELSWKTSIKILGLGTKSPNSAIRDMAQNELIDNPDLWFDFLIARNKTSHTYAEDIAKQVYAEVEKLIPELGRLIQKLENFK
jgi:nucleotidyltransferase substrate binding protein (TIGR01987 family)